MATTPTSTAPPVAAPPRSGRPHGVARNTWMRGLGLLAVISVLVLVVLVSIAIGTKDIPLPVVWDSLVHRTGTDDFYVIRDLRLPRTVVGLCVAVALGVSGALIQALTRNPLADPGILGVNSGAAFFVAMGFWALGIRTISGYVWFAFAGALALTVAVYLIGSAGRGPADPVRLVLAGVALGAVLTGLTTALTLLDPGTFDQMRSWNAGSVVGIKFDVLVPVLPFLVVGLALAGVVARPLNSLALGEDLASALGTHVTTVRVVVIIAVTLLAGGATAIAGPIGFIGLMVPHVARWIVGPDQRWILAYTVGLAPIVLLVSDIIGRVIIRPGEVPVGIVTAFVGAPVLIALVRRKKASGL